MAGSLEMPSASAVELSDLASPRQHEDANSVRVVLLEDSNSETEVANAKDDASKIHEPAGSLLARKTLLTVVACYVLAFLIAVTHYVLFRVLDGKDLSGNPVLSQPRNTAISLILVTAFRASLLTALEVSSAQSLWLLLRSKTLPVSLIESLFWMQRNIFELANPKIVRHAPILLLAAVVYWAVSIAIIYPPGALIVQSEQVSYMTKVNASVMNPRPDLNTQEDIWPVMKSLADIWFADKELFNFPTGTGSSGRFSVRYSFEAPVPRLQRIVNLGIATGQIITLTPLGTANSSHSFSFEGPQVRCRSLPKVTTTKDVRGDAFHHELVFNTSWSGVRRDEVSPATIIFSTNEVKGYFPALNQSAPAVPGSYNRSMTLVIEQSVTECDAYQTNFTVDFRYESGVQMVKYNADTGSKLLFQTRLGLRKYATKDGEYVHNSQEYREWAANLLHWNHVASCYAILDTVGKSLTYNWNLLLITSPSNTNTAGTYRLPNGSDVEINEILIPTYNDEYKDLNDYTILEDSIFNKKRFERGPFQSTGFPLVTRFDPRASLDMTENSINELLANVTISALSLNTWFANVTVNNTEFRNVYRFSFPVNLVVPYATCLAATLIFVVIGLNALRLNGVPATDGGFLQILMTTTGDTVLNRGAAEASRTSNGATKELLDIKVRYARLNEGSASGVGFGTIEETTALERKGWRIKG